MEVIFDLLKGWWLCIKFLGSTNSILGSKLEASKVVFLNLEKKGVF